MEKPWMPEPLEQLEASQGWAEGQECQELERYGPPQQAVQRAVLMLPRLPPSKAWLA